MLATITRHMKIGESDAVVALVVERAADGAAGVLPTAYVSMVRYGGGRLYGAFTMMEETSLPSS
jgi:hypothetical protein